jgi:nucleotide-binding universal stress UspA family protein
MHTLLGGQVSHVSMTAKGTMARITQAASDCDLVIFGEPEQSCPERLLAGRPCGKAIAQVPTSFLVARRPRRPIKQILLILRVEETDEAAVEWLGRLARPTDAAVTILPIVPSPPVMYNLGNRLQTGLDVLLSPNTPSGRQLRHVAQRLTRWQIESDLRLRQGEPDWQVREEVADGNYDLIIVGAEPYDRLHRLLLGELVGPLLRWLNRPLLIARPIHIGTGEIR